MGGQEKQLKMDKSRRSNGFTNSTAFSRIKDAPIPAFSCGAMAPEPRHETGHVAHPPSQHLFPQKKLTSLAEGFLNASHPDMGRRTPHAQNCQKWGR